MKKNKDRKSGYYWVTPIMFNRQVAYWNGKSWWIIGVKEPVSVKDINEKQIVEDDKDTLDT